MRRRTALPFTILVIAGLLAACAPAAMSSEPLVEQRFAVGDSAAYPMEAPAAAPPMVEGELKSGEMALLATDANRMVIQNGNMTVVVTDPAKSAEAIRSMAESMGGFVVNLNLYQSYFGEQSFPANQATITVRVPAERLNEAIEQIKAGATEVRNVSVSGEDVTAQYTDLASRLRALETAEAQLTQIMLEAKRTEDVMMVYNQLAQVQTEIEVIKGQMRYYEESADLSALTVELLPDIAAQPIETGGWQIVETLKTAAEALLGAVKVLVRAVIWLGVYVLPVLLLLALIFVLPVYVIVRAIRRRRRARRQQPPA
ncbi:MAG: DUF4349 domain-containing protein [Anaerolineales bacterium]|nr:DUF4349 domain-containing protein [Anaerolineales bacterium]